MTDMVQARQLIDALGAAARDAAVVLAQTPAGPKRTALLAAADAITTRTPDILAANARDMDFAREKGLSAAMLDRLSAGRGAHRRHRATACARSPNRTIRWAQVIAEWDRPSGLHIRRVRTPLGVIGVIYESRPNVTADAGALCLKAGNAVILRGGSESFHSSARSMPAWSRVCGPRACPRPRSSWCRPATARRSAPC